MRALAADVTHGNGGAVAAHFAVGPAFRWEVYEHFDPPNGTAGALLTAASVARFVEGVHSTQERWTSVGVSAPTGMANGPEQAVYGWSVRIDAHGVTRIGGAKIVLRCATGLVDHLVGPSDR